MKKLSVMVLSTVALALAGCGNKGGASDPYNTGSGAGSSPSERYGSTNNYQDGARSVAPIDTGDRYSTNYPGLGTNDPGSVTNSRAQPTDLERTNNVPKN